MTMTNCAIWRITAGLRVPIALVGSADSSGGPPKQFVRRSRIPKDVTLNVNGIAVTYGKWRGTALLGDGPYELARLTLRVEDADPMNAVESVAQLLEDIVDDLSFQFQESVEIVVLEALDVSQPLKVGDERRCLQFPHPIGFPSAKHIFSDPIQNLVTSPSPSLRPQEDYAPRTRAALRWYCKGLSARYDSDRFVFYWIAVEILAMNSASKISEPYMAPCKHSIPECPICGKETAKPVFGKSVQQYLIKVVGLSDTDAKDLWAMRQMVHGANHLTSKSTARLPHMAHIARYSAITALRVELGIPQGRLPTYAYDAWLKAGHFALDGTRMLKAEDI